MIALLGRAPFGEPPITVFPYEVSAEEILRLDRVTATIARENQQLLTFLRSFNPPNTYASVLRLHAERLADQLGAFRIRFAIPPSNSIQDESCWRSPNPCSIHRVPCGWPLNPCATQPCCFSK